MISQNPFGQFSTLENIEFFDRNMSNPLNFQSSGNHFKSEFGSGSSGISTDCPTFTQGEPSAVFSGVQNLFMTPQPFYPAAPSFDVLGRRMNVSMPTHDETFRRNWDESILQHQRGQLSRSKSLASNPFQANPITTVMSLEAELLHVDGWCPHENGDTIQHTMEKYRSQDGKYIIWKSRRCKKTGHLCKPFKTAFPLPC
uniref:Uncharacterized protein n=1 Tax=Arion vulgaris TaxID=1028688 RepID=A0A0B6Z4Z0_9EUPU